MESEWQISFWINECECRWDLSNWIVIWLLFSCLVWFRPSVFLIPKGNIQKCEQLLVLHFLANVHFPIGLCVYTCEYRYILYGFHKDISEIIPVGSLSLFLTGACSCTYVCWEGNRISEEWFWSTFVLFLPKSDWIQLRILLYKVIRLLESGVFYCK